MKILVGTDISGSGYTFDASAKTITLTGLNPVAIQDVLLITNVKTNAVIYQFNLLAKGGTIAANIITLTYDTTEMDDTDELQIWIQYKAPLDVNITSVLAPLIPVFATRSDTFTVAGNGVTVNVATSPVKYYSIQVTPEGAVTSWTVVLEGSLDGVTFTDILEHTNFTGSGETVYIGTSTASSLYFRSRCSAIALNGGTNITAKILGTV